jgi:GNAT superfamily N-acetyltransferase
VAEVLAAHGIRRDMERMWAENLRGGRASLLGFLDGAFAGSVHLLEVSFYAPFAAAGIPEISDFNVIPPLRRRGVGNALLEAAESLAAAHGPVVGLGVGLYASYGAAQRLYARRGYIPDGRGVMYRGRPASPGGSVVVDDDLVLYLTKAVK